MNWLTKRIGRMALGVGLLGAIHAGVCVAAPGCGALYLKGERDHARRPLANELRLPEYAVEVFCFNGGYRTWKRLSVKSWVLRARLAPGDSMLAYLLEEPSEIGRGGVVVVESAGGRVLARFEGAMGFVWNREHPRLAVTLGRDVPDQGWEPSGLIVWDAANGATKRFPVGAYDIGWLGSRRLLLDDWHHIAMLDIETGKVEESNHHGVLVSPDGRYSLLISPEGTQELWDAAAKADISNEVLRAAHAVVFTQNLDLPPFWLASRPHDLCMPVRITREKSTAMNWDQTSGHRVAVIDVERRTVIQVVPGKFLAPTSDEIGVLLSVGRGVRNVRLDR